MQNFRVPPQDVDWRNNLLITFSGKRFIPHIIFLHDSLIFYLNEMHSIPLFLFHQQTLFAQIGLEYAPLSSSNGFDHGIGRMFLPHQNEIDLGVYIECLYINIFEFSIEIYTMQTSSRHL